MERSNLYVSKSNKKDFVNMAMPTVKIPLSTSCAIASATAQRGRGVLTTRHETRQPNSLLGFVRHSFSDGAGGQGGGSPRARKLQTANSKLPTEQGHCRR